MPDALFAKGTPSQVLRHMFGGLRGVNQFFDETGAGAASSSKCASGSDITEQSESHSLPDSISLILV